MIPFTFSSKTKSDLGWAFLALIDSGRLQDHTPAAEGPDALNELQALFFNQLAHCQYEIQTGPDKRIRWGVPDGTRNLASGELVHDDLVVSAALLGALDPAPAHRSLPPPRPNASHSTLLPSQMDP